MQKGLKNLIPRGEKREKILKFYGELAKKSFSEIKEELRKSPKLKVGIAKFYACGDTEEKRAFDEKYLSKIRAINTDKHDENLMSMIQKNIKESMTDERTANDINDYHKMKDMDGVISVGIPYSITEDRNMKTKYAFGMLVYEDKTPMCFEYAKNLKYYNQY